MHLYLERKSLEGMETVLSAVDMFIYKLRQLVLYKTTLGIR